MPLILGSLIAVVPMLMYPVILVHRVKNEEIFLTENLEGYREYTEKVKWRIVPFIW
jgi:protein-S-isoprenylcysteine O-methyltransferase Ste14